MIDILSVLSEKLVGDEFVFWVSEGLPILKYFLSSPCGPGSLRRNHFSFSINIIKLTKNKSYENDSMAIIIKNHSKL